MKNALRVLLFIGILPLVLLTGCKDDPVEPDQTEFEQLSDYLTLNNLDLTDVLNGWVKTGSAINVDPVDFSVPDYYVIDLRGADDFNAGHIKDAHNATIANVLEEAEKANGKPILVVCYTGQTAARAVAGLRLMDFEAYSLKWGMSAWHTNLAGKWQTNATDFSSPNWVTNGDPAENGLFEAPNLNTGEIDGPNILRNRVQAMLNRSSWGISKVDLLDNPANYFVVNKWPIESWEAYGHIVGAYRIDEELNLNGLKYLDPGKTNVVYCYTGQTSAITSGWLDVMGYDVKSLMFGANGIVHSNMVVGTAGSAKAKSWHGEGSNSELNFGYYDANGNLINPL